MNVHESKRQVGQGLAMMWKGESAAARMLRAAALYLVAFALVTALIGHLAGSGWRLVASLVGLIGMYALVRRFDREARRQDAEESAGENS